MNHKHETNSTAVHRAKNNLLHWSMGGMVGGLIVGLALANIYGWTVVNTTFWLGFGLLVGAVSGGLSYIIYRAAYAVIQKEN